MCKIALVSMPVCMLQYPSISLTQLKSVAKQKHGDRVSIDVYQLNHDFAAFMGLRSQNGNGSDEPLWEEFFDDTLMHATGLGDWLFRHVAVPDAEDNPDYYFARYYDGRKDEAALQALKARRPKLEAFLEGLIDEYGLDQADIVGFASMFQQT